MDVGRNSKGNSAAKLLKKTFGSICGVFSASTAPVQHNNEDEQAFMFCILQANTSKKGWERSVISVLKNCKGVSFQMDGDGRVEVGGIGDPNKLLWQIAKSSKVKQEWFQYSQCSSKLFPPPPPPPPQPTKKEEKQPPPQQDYNYNYNYNYNNPPRLPTGGGGGYDHDPGYQYPPRPHPRIFWF